MDADGEDGFENEEQFWLGSWNALPPMARTIFANQSTALDEISEAPYESHEHIDNALRSFLALTTLYKRTRTPLSYHAPPALTARREVPTVGE